jgi:hypothetical protein
MVGGLPYSISGGAALPDFQKRMYQTPIRTLSPDLEEW